MTIGTSATSLPTQAPTPAPAERTGTPEVNLAQLFRNRSQRFADQTRWRQQRDGVWQRATFRENQAMVNALISGLDALGARPGDVAAILSNTRWEWMVADWAIMGLGCVTATIYASNVPSTIAYILNDSDARFLFLENRAQYDKVRSMSDQLPNLRALIMFDDAALVTDDPRVIAFADLLKLSSRTPDEADAFAAACAAAIQPEDHASLVYTSGTTGQPKGVIQSHQMLLAQVAGAGAMLYTVFPGMRDLLFLPLSHVLGRLESLFGVDEGSETTVVPSLDRVADSLREAKPQLFLSVPRIYEKAYAAILAKVKASPRPQRIIFHWAQGVGREISLLRQDHKRLPIRLRLANAIADRLVFHKVREALGGSLQFAVTGGAPLEAKILGFFHASGALLLEGWGLTETGGAFTVNMVDRYRIGTVGLPFPGHEIRIAPDGEILVRGPTVFSGYHNNPEATAEAIDGEGWFHTGDIGSLDTDGFLRILDRKKELIVTAGGKKIAPQYIEGLLKTIPLISQACVYGDTKPYVVALLTLNPDAVAVWARDHETSYASIADVYTMPAFRASLDARIAHTNEKLASYETVKYYDVLTEDFTVENDLLTPTLKIRRKQIYARYHERFEALYRPTPDTLPDDAS